LNENHADSAGADEEGKGSLMTTDDVAGKPNDYYEFISSCLQYSLLNWKGFTTKRGGREEEILGERREVRDELVKERKNTNNFEKKETK